MFTFDLPNVKGVDLGIILDFQDLSQESIEIYSVNSYFISLI